MNDNSQVIFITGFPGVITCGVATLLAGIEDVQVRLLASDEHQTKAEEFIEQTKGDISIIKGAEGRIDFGLSGRDYHALSNEITGILHLILPLPPGAPLRKPSMRTMAREVIELGLVANRLSHVVVLSHLDVAGTSVGVFAERDLDLGQGFADPACEDRFRAEGVFQRFMDAVPITLVRPGWIVGDDPGLCPLISLLLAVDDLSSLPTKDPGSRLLLVDAQALVRVLAGLIQSEPTEGMRTLHLVFSQLPALQELVTRVQNTADKMAPSGFELTAGARRGLGRAGPGEVWSAKEFFKKDG